MTCNSWSEVASVHIIVTQVSVYILELLPVSDKNYIVKKSQVVKIAVWGGTVIQLVEFYNSCWE